MEQLKVSFSFHPYVERSSKRCGYRYKSISKVLADTLNHYLEIYLYKNRSLCMFPPFNNFSIFCAYSRESALLSIFGKQEIREIQDDNIWRPN